MSGGGGGGGGGGRGGGEDSGKDDGEAFLGSVLVEGEQEWVSSWGGERVEGREKEGGREGRRGRERGGLLMLSDAGNYLY